MPKTCKECDLFTEDTAYGIEYCIFQQFAEDFEFEINYYDELEAKGERPPWCPLVELDKFIQQMRDK
jgi:hypothetical protein